MSAQILNFTSFRYPLVTCDGNFVLNYDIIHRGYRYLGSDACKDVEFDTIV